MKQVQGFRIVEDCFSALVFFTLTITKTIMHKFLLHKYIVIIIELKLIPRSE